MAELNPATLSRARGAAASSFETATSTPSSRVDTPSPGSAKKNKKTINKNKDKSKKKEPVSESNTEIGDISMEDQMEAGTSKTSQAVPKKGGVAATGSGGSDCEIVETRLDNNRQRGINGNENQERKEKTSGSRERF